MMAIAELRREKTRLAGELDKASRIASAGATWAASSTSKSIERCAHRMAAMAKISMSHIASVIV